jgi:ABC-type polysaccharide/polyol phosphate transport system ATPase subunit
VTNPPVIRARGLTKVYRSYDSPWQRLLEALSGRPRHRELRALDGVGFDLHRGEGLAVVGENGAGKSTLMKILAGITAPSSGELAVQGKVASILELGSGFHPEFTGRQNIVLNAAMLGLDRGEVEAKTPRIIEFSELGEFIDRPVKTYSTGMAMRLGFAIATQVEPDVLIIDEALSVGDGYFQKKCMDRMRQFVDDGGTLLFCSHAMYYVSHFCRQAIWLRNGRPEAQGPVDQVVRRYESFLAEKSGNRLAEEAREAQVADAARPPAGSVPARLVDVALDAPAAAPVYRPGDRWAVEVACECDSPRRALNVGIGINRSDGTEVAAFSTYHDGLEPLSGELRHRLRLEIPVLPLVKGEFSLYVFLLDEAGLHVYDERVLPAAFRVESPEYRYGLLDVAHHWERDGGCTPAVTIPTLHSESLG